MTNVLSLRVGDRLPDFVLPGLDGKLRKFIWSFTGDPVVLLAVADLKLIDVEPFALLRSACTAASTRLVVVAANEPAGATSLWKKLGAEPENPLLLLDQKAQFLPALLAQGGAVSFGQGMGLRQRAIVLDPNQRVASTLDTRVLAATTETIGDLAESVRANAGSGLLINTALAPVLILPRVFEPDFCTQLIRLWGKGDHKDSGVSSRYGNVNVEELKRTEDYMIVEPMMQKAVSDRLAYRVGPELTKVFAFDRQFTFDAHVVLSYSAEGEHFFGAHRDNGAPTTADRAFAVSLNLNDDFEGGELVFPEYAGVRVSPPAGAAAVFSCSLLHKVGPVTRGRRYVLTTFFRQKR
ncbi:2OG-Fe(II) oxygenase [Reyranella sp.]|uniref:2OG-Fe(II) oxygenase n=1 Tax=Reyranella sp. TaxID=1929291 RepID=UPI00120F2E9D|nr:2OG-Fe(II) oxygenase [Reyranella sp.]TAJ87337.1 MAG: 2OG-Fe(II) oxygenase [Reyranella sp.]